MALLYPIPKSHSSLEIKSFAGCEDLLENLYGIMKTPDTITVVINTKTIAFLIDTDNTTPYLKK